MPFARFVPACEKYSIAIFTRSMSIRVFRSERIAQVMAKSYGIVAAHSAHNQEGPG